MRETYVLRFFLVITGLLETLCDEIPLVNHTNTPSDQESVKLLYGESHGISWTDLASNDRMPPLLARRFLDVYSVDYHYARNLIFFTGWGAVWRLPMEEAGSDAQGVEILAEDAGAAALAVDWEHDHVYWTCPATRTVWRFSLQGDPGWGDVIIQDEGNLTKHSNLVVDPYMRYLFLATESGYSLRSDLDGGDLERLDHGLVLSSLALDIHNRRLYVSGYQAFAPVLRSVDYRGGDVIDYSLHHTGHDGWVRLMSIDVFSSGPRPQLFWVHHGWGVRDTAWKVEVLDGQLSWQKEYFSRGTILDPETRIWCVKVCHPDVQTRPRYWGRERSSTNATDGFSGAPATRNCLLFQAFSCLALVLISRLTFA